MLIIDKSWHSVNIEFYSVDLFDYILSAWNFPLMCYTHLYAVSQKQQMKIKNSNYENQMK